MAKSSFKVNTDYLPIKAHYFLYNGALAGVIPYLPVVAEQLGMSYASIGIIFAVLPFSSFIGKPLFGGIADNLQKLKPMLMIFLLLIICSTLGINFIPPLSSGETPSSKNLSSLVSCSHSGTSFQISKAADEFCLSQIPESDVLNCSLTCFECAANHSRVAPHTLNDECQAEIKRNIDVEFHRGTGNHIITLYQWIFEVANMSVDEYPVNLSCASDTLYHCNASCSPNFGQCFIDGQKPVNNMLQFWTFFILAIITYLSAGIAVSLSDAACFNILKDKGHLYGKQRVFGTIGWGSSAALAGYLMGMFSSDRREMDYGSGFYILTGLMLFDLVAVHFMKMDNLKMSKSILKDVTTLLRRPNVLVFIIAVFLIGVFTGMLWSFLFIYLVGLGAGSSLLGYAAGVQCIGELPFFFFSGWIIEKIGHSWTLTITFLCFGSRFIAYSYLTNPWLVLPIELLQGGTFGAFYTAMTSYASTAALPGTEATMQGLVGGAFEGLGVAVGGLLGGLGMQKGGGQFLFFWAGMAAFIAGCLHSTLDLILRNMKDKEVPNEMDMSPNIEETDTFI